MIRQLCRKGTKRQTSVEDHGEDAVLGKLPVSLCLPFCLVGGWVCCHSLCLAFCLVGGSAVILFIFGFVWWVGLLLFSLSCVLFGGWVCCHSLCLRFCLVGGSAVILFVLQSVSLSRLLQRMFCCVCHGCIASNQHAESVSGTCLNNLIDCHTEIEVADGNAQFHL